MCSVCVQKIHRSSKSVENNIFCILFSVCVQKMHRSSKCVENNIYCILLLFVFKKCIEAARVLKIIFTAFCFCLCSKNASKEQEC